MSPASSFTLEITHGTYCWEQLDFIFICRMDLSNLGKISGDLVSKVKKTWFMQQSVEGKDPFENK